MLEHQQDIKRSFVPSSQTVLNIHYLQKSSGWFDFSSDAVEVALKEPSWFEALLGSQSPWTAHQDCWIFKVVGSKRWSLISRYKESSSEETCICVAHLHGSATRNKHFHVCYEYMA